MYRLLCLFTDLQSFFVKLFAFILMYFAPISNYVHLVILLIMIDLVTGSYAAIKEGQKFSARKLRNTIEKFIFYAVAIIVAYVLQQIINDGSELARWVALYVGATEAKSIYENISRITKKDIIAIFWSVLKGKLDELYNKSDKSKES